MNDKQRLGHLSGNRGGATNWRGRAAASCAAGAGAALMGLLVAPLAYADDPISGGAGSPALPAAGTAATDNLTSASENYLETQYTAQNWDDYDATHIPTYLPDAGAATAYGEIDFMYNDGMTTFVSFYNETDQFYSAIIGDAGTVGQLIEGAIGNAGSIISAVGGLAKGAAATDPLTDPSSTASDYITAINQENAILTENATNLAAATQDVYGNGTLGDDTVLNTAANYEFPVVVELEGFQQQIGAALENLPALTAGEETNSTLISYLSGVFTEEVNMNTYIIELNDALLGASPIQITEANAAILDNSVGIFDGLQDAIQSLTYLQDWGI